MGYNITILSLTIRDNITVLSLTIRDNITATTLNNLGYLLKENKRYSESKLYYTEAMKIRVDTLGETHPDSIVSMNNLAECLLAEGKLSR